LSTDVSEVRTASIIRDDQLQFHNSRFSGSVNSDSAVVWRLKSNSWQGRIFLFSTVWVTSGAHAVSYPVGSWVPSMGVKRLGRVANHCHPSGAEVKNAWSYTSVLHTCSLHAVMLG
jgi:hypothetical protein